MNIVNQMMQHIHYQILRWYTIKEKETTLGEPISLDVNCYDPLIRQILSILAFSKNVMLKSLKNASNIDDIMPIYVENRFNWTTIANIILNMKGYIEAGIKEDTAVDYQIMDKLFPLAEDESNYKMFTITEDDMFKDFDLFNLFKILDLFAFSCSMYSNHLKKGGEEYDNVYSKIYEKLSKGKTDICEEDLELLNKTLEGTEYPSKFGILLGEMDTISFDLNFIHKYAYSIYEIVNQKCDELMKAFGKEIESDNKMIEE